MLYVIVAIFALGLLITAYFTLAPEPHRWRVYRQASRALVARNWQAALPLAQSLQQPGLPIAWQVRLRQLEGEAHQLALEETLKAGDFEAAMEHAQQAAKLLEMDVAEQRGRVVEASLADLRRLYAAGTAQTEEMLHLLTRIAELAGTQPTEATLWQALSLIRQGQLEQAQMLLQRVCEESGKQIIDGPLYLGMLLHRLGKPQEALRLLAEANRIDSNCPILPWQMGVSLVSSSGDAGLAVKLLQRAVSNRGLAAFLSQPERLWIDGLPEGRSYVRRLAIRHTFHCPLLGEDLSILLRQANLALAQALFRQQRFADAAEQYAKLLQNTPPTPLLLRGYGLALVRTGQYDQAYKQLRLAFDQESPRDPLTAGYLALCGALGKPANPDDKPRNVQGALQLLARFPVLGNSEWAGIISTVVGEARRSGVEIGAKELTLLCNALASVQAHDSQAAGMYAELAQRFPDAVVPIYAWLYARAITVHGGRPVDLDLFARTFQTPAARAFYEQQGWDFDQVEYIYLKICAEQQPGQFPQNLGQDYPTRGEAFLLERSYRQEREGQLEPARDCAQILLHLAPTSLVGHDRLACLHYRTGDIDNAVRLLQRWQQLAPNDHWPLVRQAVLEQQRGNAQRREQAIRQALGLTKGPLRAAIAYLGACLALRAGRTEANRSSQSNGIVFSELSLQEGQDLLQECLQEQPDHVQALWSLAAIRSVQGDRESLSQQAVKMDRPEIQDGRFHFLGAVCCLAARDYERAIQLSNRAANTEDLVVESQFLQAWARLRRGETGIAQQLFRQVADRSESSSSALALAMLGSLHLADKCYDETVSCWSSIDTSQRIRWGLEDPLRQVVYLAGLKNLQEQHYERAADRFREASRLGLRDRQLAGLIGLSLLKAGQRLLVEAVKRANCP